MAMSMSSATGSDASAASTDAMVARVAGARGVKSWQQSSSGTIEMLVRADALRVGGDFFLVHADERPEHRQRRRRADGGQVLQRLRRDLADRLAGDERAGALPAGQALGDAQHQPPVDQDAQRRRNRDQHPLLHLAERHEIEAGALLVARQHLRQPSRLLLGHRRHESGNCESEPAARGSRGASSATRPPASRCRPTCRHATRPLTPVGRPPAPCCLSK